MFLFVCRWNKLLTDGFLFWLAVSSSLLRQLLSNSPNWDPTTCCLLQVKYWATTTTLNSLNSAEGAKLSGPHLVIHHSRVLKHRLGPVLVRGSVRSRTLPLEGQSCSLSGLTSFDHGERFLCWLDVRTWRQEMLREWAERRREAQMYEKIFLNKISVKIINISKIYRSWKWVGKPKRNRT